jgi:hypothetical protein
MDRSVSNKEEDSSKTYFDLYEAKKGWNISMFTLWEGKGMSIDIWTDRKSCRQLLIAIRGKGVAGVPPIQFMLLDDSDCTLGGSFSVISPELLSEGRQKALDYMYDPVNKPKGIPYEDLFCLPKAA